MAALCVNFMMQECGEISGKSGIRDTGFGSSGTRAARAAAGQELFLDLSVKQNGKYTLSCELQKD